jgi:hypothetical protein
MKTAAVDSVAADSEIPEALRQVRDSRTFERAPALRGLLLYLWRNRVEPVSEYAIATEALGRSPGFDAKTDATVRVQISRLRQRLERYYEEEGRGAPERIAIPLGSHLVRIEPVKLAPPPDPPTAPVAVPVVLHKPSRMNLYLMALCAVLLVACSVLIATRPTPGAQRIEPVRFWKAFFGNGRSTRIVLPTPLFFSFQRQQSDRFGAIMLRDTEVNDFGKRATSPQYRQLESLLGPAQLATNYTVTSDTFASVRLARYLDGAGFATTVLSSADASLEALDSENVIALGTWGTLSPLQPYLDRMHYVLGAHEVTVEVRNPGAGDPARVQLVQESTERSVWPGVIGVLPGRGGQSHLLVLASRHTSALVSFLTSHNGLDQLEPMWKAQGSPEYFETIVNAEMNGDQLVRFWPVSLRPFRP